MNKTLLYLVTEDWYFISHRLSLALAAKKNGYDVHIACKDTGKMHEIKSYGFKCHKIRLDRGYSSIFSIINNVKEVKLVIKEVKPLILHTVALQSIILGLCATILNKNIITICAVTGLGSLFLSQDYKTRITRLLIIIFLIFNFKKRNVSIIVQNKDDAFFVNNKLFCTKNKIFIIRGSGVDIKHHGFQKEPKYPPIVLAYVGRLIEDKGILTLIKAFKIIDKKKMNIKLLLVGTTDVKNVSSITDEHLINITNNSNIELLGEISDVREIWKQSHIAILPSKREGLPKSLLEAASAGRPIIATDVPGCREIAKNGENAVTVKVNNVEELYNAIIYLSENHKMRKYYGLKSRNLVKSDMSEEEVIKNTLLMYKKLVF